MRCLGRPGAVSGTVGADSFMSFHHIMPRSRREPLNLRLEITQMLETLMTERKQAIAKLENEVVEEGIEEKKKESEPESELSPCKEYKETKEEWKHHEDISKILRRLPHCQSEIEGKFGADCE